MSKRVRELPLSNQNATPDFAADDSEGVAEPTKIFNQVMVGRAKTKPPFSKTLLPSRAAFMRPLLAFLPVAAFYE
ncbi:hypothetical protein KCP71_12415 [Salmonella enterica subsp. enterica]|nr:hypothetical protein KCP71_12415 [Salmonella enterica subsp. enterica]